MTPEQSQIAFRALVLQALWIIIKSVYRGPWATDWRANAIGYMDTIGPDNPEAKKYRREISFPE